LSGRRFRVLVCRGPECGDKRNSREVYDQFRRVLEDRGAVANVDLRWQSCFGRCSQGPNCLIREIVTAPGQPEQRFVFAALPSRRGVTALYNGVTPADVAELTDRHILGGHIVRRLIRRPRMAAAPAPRSPEKNE
jgi:(2Fe-2S) ferredoxin